MLTNYTYTATVADFKDYNTYRSYDERACEVVNDFLDTKFYPVYTESSERVDEKKYQVQGVDIKFDLSGTTYICDEKAAVKWMNKNLKTYAMELEFINRGGYLNDGWFVNDSQINNSYCLIYTDKIEAPYNSFTTEDIKEVTVIIVTKDSIKDYLADKGWTAKNLKNKCKEIRSKGGYGVNMGNIQEHGLKFSYSQQLPEKPINVLIPRDELENMSVLTVKYNNG